MANAKLVADVAGKVIGASNGYGYILCNVVGIAAAMGKQYYDRKHQDELIAKEVAKQVAKHLNK